MNKEEILAMKAGRKLDGLVAAEVMGIEVEYPYTEGYPYYLREDKPHGKMKWDIVAFYSTDISAAWQVMERMRSDSSLLWQFSLALSEMSLNQDSRCIKADHITDLIRWLCPEAICKAALLAKLKE